MSNPPQPAIDPLTGEPRKKHAGGRPKGYPKSGGRKKRGLGHKTIEARIAASSIVDDPRYLANVARRAMKGTLPPAMEVMLWAYAKGKPSDTLVIQGGLDLNVKATVEAEADEMSTEQLQAIVAHFDAIAAIKAGPPRPLLTITAVAHKDETDG